MANYTDAESVAVLIGMDNFASDSRPTLTQVNSIIAEITNDIDFTLKSIGVTVQPTDSTLLGRLTIICKYGSACQVAVSGYGNADSIDGSQGDKFCERYKEMLEDIKENPEDYGLVTGDSTLFISNQVSDGTITETEQTALFLPNEYEV